MRICRLLLMATVLLALCAPAMLAADDGPQLFWTTGRGHETAWDCPRDEQGRQYAHVGDKIFVDWYNFSSDQNGYHYMYERLSEPNSAKVRPIDSWGGYMAGKQGVCDAEGLLVSTRTEIPTADSPVIVGRLIVKPKMMTATMTQSSIITGPGDKGVYTVEIAVTNISDQMLNNVSIEGKSTDPLLDSGFTDLIVWANRSFVVPPAPQVPYGWAFPKLVPGSIEVQLPGSLTWVNPSSDFYSGGIPAGKLGPDQTIRFKFQIRATLVGFG